jgi:hypothetical protein
VVVVPPPFVVVLVDALELVLAVDVDVVVCPDEPEAQPVAIAKRAKSSSKQTAAGRADNVRKFKAVSF